MKMASIIFRCPSTRGLLQRGCVILMLWMVVSPHRPLHATPTQMASSAVSWSNTERKRILRPAWNTPVDGVPDQPGPPEPPNNPVVAVSLSQTAIDNEFSGILDLTITGLNPGATVLLERFRVSNNQGQIDPGAILQSSYLLTDGFFPQQGEVYNFNVPNDTGDRDGNITAQLDFWEGSVGNIPGEFVHRVSSPTADFAPATVPLTITSASHPQHYHGVVSSGGSPLPGAYIAMLDPLGRYNDFIKGVVSDANGQYQLDSPYPGEFDLVATMPGYVGAYGRDVQAFLPENGTTQKDFELVAGDRIVSGTVEVNGSGEPVAGLLLTLLSIDANDRIDLESITIGWTQADGSFSIPVTAGRWGLFVGISEASARGLLTRGSAPMAVVDASAGNVDQLDITLDHGQSVIWGTLVSAEDGVTPLQGVEMVALDLEGDLAGWGVTDGDGDFRIAVTPGYWEVGPFSYTLELVEHPGSTFQEIHVPDVDQSVLIEPSAPPKAGEIYGFLEDENGDPVGKMTLLVVNEEITDPLISVTQSTYASDGYFCFYLPAGDWKVLPLAADAAERGLLFEDLPQFSITESSNLVSEMPIPVVAPTSEVSITLTDAQNQPLPGILIHGLAMLNGHTYDSFGQTDANGVATLPAHPGMWKFHASVLNLRQAGQAELPLFSLNVSGSSTATQLQTMPLDDAPAFELQVMRSDETNLIMGQGTPGQRYAVDASLDLENWFELGRVLAIEGEFLVADEIGAFAERLFYRFRTD